MTHIREVRLSDAANLARLERVAWSGPWNEAALVATLGTTTSRGWLATRGNAQRESEAGVGFVLFRAVVDEAELLRMAVAIQARRRGVGGDLLATALRSLDGDGIETVHLEVAGRNQGARRLYARHGFVVTGRRSGYYDDGDDAVLMQRRRPVATRLAGRPGRV